MNYQKTAKEIIDAVGGKANIKSITHCITRLRFILNDFSIPIKDNILKIDGVISIIEQGGQYQIVIGNKVTNVYNEIIKELEDIPDTNKLDLNEKKDDTSNKSMLDKFVNTVSGIFLPVLGAMAASGVIKGILAILSVTNILSNSSGTYIVLEAFSNSFFYFMPIILGASSAKYFKFDIYLGALLGAILIYPNILSHANDDSLTFLSIPVNVIDYTSSVFPIIITVWLASKINKIIGKLPLRSLKFLLQPFIVLLITAPIALIVIGPIISFLSIHLANIINNIYNFSPIIAGAVLGGSWILMVMFGLHWAFMPIFINNIATQGFDPLLGLLLANQFAMAGSSIAVGTKTKQEKLKTLSLSTGFTTLLGISEPALYGVLLPYKKPLIASIIGGCLGGMLTGLTNTLQYGIGGSGLLCIPLIINPNGLDLSFYGGISSQIVGFIAGFLITYIWGFTKKDDVVL